MKVFLKECISPTALALVVMVAVTLWSTNRYTDLATEVKHLKEHNEFMGRARLPLPAPVNEDI